MKMDRRTAYTRRLVAQHRCRMCRMGLELRDYGYTHCFDCRVIRAAKAKAQYWALKARYRLVRVGRRRWAKRAA